MLDTQIEPLVSQAFEPLLALGLSHPRRHCVFQPRPANPPRQDDPAARLTGVCGDPANRSTPPDVVACVEGELNELSKPALLGRVVLVPYYPLRDEVLQAIIRLKLDKIVRRVGDSHGVRLEYNVGVVDVVASRCTEVESGARNVDSVLTNTMLPDLSTMLQGRLAEGFKPAAIRVSVGESGQFEYTME